MLAVGIVLWLCTWLWNRGVRAKKTGFHDVDSLT
jgi:APA family basic amino acid/polyamine antiporter